MVVIFFLNFILLFILVDSQINNKLGFENSIAILMIIICK